MQNLDPTYLRYIYDGLIKGSVHPENTSELPEGLVGLYEDAFEEHLPILQRQKLLKFFTFLSLLKKEVSVEFIAEILEENELEINDFIINYTSWFNSPVSGKYQLYHERLKVYFLQKLSEKEIDSIHEKLITRLENAIIERKKDEIELYSLEFLPIHLSITKENDLNYKKLILFVNNENIWERQIKLSKGFDWTNKGLQLAIRYSAIRHLELNSLECTIKSIKLLKKEEQSADEILSLLLKGDYLIAIQRAERLGVERNFRILLLMIHELTIGKYKKSLFRIKACQAVIEAFEYIPADMSIINWCKFYPEDLIFSYHISLTKLGLDSSAIWKRGNFDLRKIMEENSEGMIHFSEILPFIINQKTRYLNYMDLSILTLRQGDIEMALSYANESGSYKMKTHLTFITILIEKENFTLFDRFLDTYIETQFKFSALISAVFCCNSKKLVEKSQYYLLEANKILIQNTNIQTVANFIEIIRLFRILSNKELLNNSFKHVLKIINTIQYTKEKSSLLREIIYELILSGKKSKAILLSNEIQDEWEKAVTMRFISKHLADIGNVKKAVDISLSISSNIESSRSLFEVSKILSIKRRLNEAFKISNKIVDNYVKCLSFLEIASVLIRDGKPDEAFKYIQKTINESILIKSEKDHDLTLRECIKKLSEINFLNEAQNTILKIYDWKQKSISHRELSWIFIKDNKIDEALEEIKKIINDNERFIAYLELAIEMFNLKRNIEFERFIVYCSKELDKIEDINEREVANRKFIELLFKTKQRKTLFEAVLKTLNLETTQDSLYDIEIDLNLFCSFVYLKFEKKAKKTLKFLIGQILKIQDSYNRYQAINKLFYTLNKSNYNFTEYKSILTPRLEQLSDFQDSKYKTDVYQLIFLYLNNIENNKTNYLKYLKKSILSIENITDNRSRSEAYLDASISYNILDKKEDAIQLLEKALYFSSLISGVYSKSSMQVKLSIEFMKQSKIDRSLTLIESIIGENEKSSAYYEISLILLQKGYREEAFELIKSITRSYWKFKTYTDLSIELINKGLKKDFSSFKENSLALMNDVVEKNDKDLAKHYMSIILLDFEMLSEAIDLANTIEEPQKSKTFSQLALRMMKKGDSNTAFSLASEIKINTIKRICFENLANINSFSESLLFFKSNFLGNNRHLFAQALSKSLENSQLTNEEEFYLLYNLSDYTYLFKNYLLYKARKAFFYESKIEVAKINMIDSICNLKNYKALLKSI